MLRKMLKVNLDDLIPLVAVLGGEFVIYELVEAVIFLGFKPQNADAINICGMMLLMTAAIMSLAVGCIYPRMNVNILLKHSVTRKNALMGTLASTALNMAVLLGLALVLGRLDDLIAAYWVKTLPWVTGMDGVTASLWLYPLILVVLMCLTTGIGALLQRFGKQATWACVIVWFALCFGSNLIDLDGLIESSAIPTPAFVIVGAAVCLVSFFGGSALLLRATVTE